VKFASLIAAGRAGVRKFVSARRVYWAAVVCLFLYAAFLRWRLPLEPFFDPDTYGYLAPAVSKLLGWSFFHALRNYFYPVFLLLTLGLFADLRAIVVVQHVFGLAAGLIFLLVWERLRSFMPEAVWPRYLHRFLGLVATAVYLTAEEPIRFEMYVRPEGIAPFLIILSIFCSVEFSYRCYVRRPREMSVILGLGSVVTSIVATLARPNLALAEASLLIGVAAAPFCCGSRKQKVVLVGSCLVTALVLILPAHLPARSDLANITVLPRHLFLVHADVMRDQIASDLSEPGALKYPRDLLERVHQILASEINRSPTNRKFPVLGFNPNMLMYGPKSADRQLLAQFGGQIDDLSAFYRYYYERAWRKRPGAMAGKIGRQILAFYVPLCPAYRLESRDLWLEYKITTTYAGGMRQAFAEYEPLQRPQLVARTAELANSRLRLGVPLVFWYCQAFLGRTYVFLVAGAAIVLATSLFHRLVRARIAALAMMTALLCWYNFAAALEVAVFTTIDFVRYSTVQLIAVLLAQFTASLLIVRFLFELKRVRGAAL